MKAKLLFYGLFINITLFCQSTTVITTLSSALHETSGLIHLDGHIITHSDSGGEAALFEIDTVTGNYSRKVIVENAVNTDWEDITVDQSHIYIGDFGNNDGNRTDLKIYKISINDYLNSSNDSVLAAIIYFNYSDQIDFNPGQFSTNYDAEALIAYNDSLYIFTKNWGNYMTNIYSVSNAPGSYSISKVDSLNPQGLITGATYDSLTQTLLLCGYQTNAFTYKTIGFVPPHFSLGNSQKTVLTVQNSFQIEGITLTGNNYYLSSENNPLGAATLYRFDSLNGLHLTENSNIAKTKLDPNPCIDMLNIQTDIKYYSVIVYDIVGKTILKTINKGQVDFSGLKCGMYHVEVKDLKTNDTTIQLILKG